MEPDPGAADRKKRVCCSVIGEQGEPKSLVGLYDGLTALSVHQSGTFAFGHV